MTERTALQRLLDVLEQPLTPAELSTNSQGLIDRHLAKRKESS